MLFLGLMNADLCWDKISLISLEINKKILAYARFFVWFMVFADTLKQLEIKQVLNDMRFYFWITHFARCSQAKRLEISSLPRLIFGLGLYLL